jgi:hypothetical protein
MNIEQALQVLMDQQLELGLSKDKILAGLSAEVERLQRVYDIDFIALHPLSQREMAMIRSVNEYGGQIERIVSHYCCRVPTASRKQGKKAVHDYWDHIREFPFTHQR